MNVADPTYPVVAEATIDTEGSPTGLTARDDLILTQNSAGDIAVMERTSNGIAVRAVHRLSAYSSITSDVVNDWHSQVRSEVEIWDQKAAVVSTINTSSEGTLTVLDLHATAAPTELASIDFYGEPGAIAMHGNHLFVGIASPAPPPIDGITEIRVWNLTNPYAPEIEAVIPYERRMTDKRSERDRSGIDGAEIAQKSRAPIEKKSMTRVLGGHVIWGIDAIDRAGSDEKSMAQIADLYIRAGLTLSALF